MLAATNIDAALQNVMTLREILGSRWQEPRTELEDTVLEILHATQIQLAQIRDEVERAANTVRRVQ